MPTPESFSSLEPMPEFRARSVESQEAMSEEFIAKILSSRDFISRCKEAVKRQNENSGRELGFAVLKHPEKAKTYYTEVVGGELFYETKLDDITREMIEMVIEKEKIKEESSIPIIMTFHMHLALGKDPDVFPSSEDIEADAGFREQNSSTGRDYPVISATAVRMTDGEMKILFYREPLHYRPMLKEGIFEELQESLEGAQTGEEVIQILEHYGYVATITRTRSGRIEEEEIKRLSHTLAYDPREKEQLVT